MDDALRRAFEAGLPYTSLRDFTPDPRLISAIGVERARAAGIVPVLVIGDRLQVAARSPEVDLARLARGLPEVRGVDLAIAPPGAIDAALDRAARAQRAASPRRLGELLVERGAATTEDVEEALVEQERTGGRFGDVLLARNAVAEEDLVGALADQFGLPVTDLAATPDRASVALVPEDLQRRGRLVPLAHDASSVFLAVVDPLDDRMRDTLRTATAREPRPFLAPRAALDDLLWSLHAERWAADVARRRPAAEGRAGLEPLPATGTRRATVLMLLGRGAGDAVRAAATIGALAHPRSCLEVLLLCRRDDEATLRAARGLARRPPHRVVPLPESLPPTRGAALAYGAHVARGELLVLLEAGDVPAAGLIAAATAGLVADGAHAGAAQAADDDGLAGRLAERLGRPRVRRSGLVVRADALRAAGYWDPQGDGGDLGRRLRARGLRIVALGADATVAPGG